MSDQSQGPGWWIASDGKWYPPQPTTGATSPVDPTAPLGAPIVATPPAAPHAYDPTNGVPTYPGSAAGPGYPDGSPTGYEPGANVGYPAGPPPGYPPTGQVPGDGSSGGRSKTGLAIVVAVLAVLLIGGGVAFTLTRSSNSTTAAGTTKVTIDVPDDLVGAFQSGAQNGKYVFYAVAGKVPDWNAVSKAGIFICSEDRPPLIPQSARGALDSGGFRSGTLVTLNTKDITDVLRIKQLIVTVPAAVDGCTPVALTQMSDTAGMLLMTDANASFAEKGQLVEVLLE